MNITITPGKTNGTVFIPPSKSLTQRAFAGALLHHGKTKIINYGSSDDEKAALNIIQQLGAVVEEYPDHLMVSSRGISPISSVIHCGESGLAARLFIPIIATYNQPITITGSGSLLKRPMQFFQDLLPQLNVWINESKAYLPITLKGPLQAKSITIDGSLSSQFLTGILFAYAFTATEKISIQATNLTSKPYIDLTLETLQAFGKKVQNVNYERFIITPSPMQKNEIDFVIESDWSSAAYWIVAGLINGAIAVKGLNEYSSQADHAIMDVVKQCGGNTIWINQALHIQSSQHLAAFDFDAANCPDLFPVLSILATQCEGTSSIKGLHRLIHKESNRKESICDMLTRFGAAFRIEEDHLFIQGKSTLHSCTVSSFNDHRIAMAAAIGALAADGTVTIENAACVSKSYPDFFRDLQQLGINTTTEL